MGRTLYVPDDHEEPYLADAGGDLDVAKETMLDVLNPETDLTAADVASEAQDAA